MAISDSYLKSCLGRERDKVEEKADRDGLWVRISKKGAVTFFYRFRFLGKQDKMTIGSYPEFGLKAARDEVAKWAAILARGENPRIRQSLDKAKINSQYTFEELFREWHSMVCIQKESAGQVLRSFELHVFPKLGKYPAHQLTLHNWLTVLDRLAQGYSEITRRVISNGRQCYSWAVKRQLLEVNPLSEMSGRDFGIQKQMGERTLDRKELAIVWRAIEDSRLIERNKILYKLSLIWACRVGELRQAEVAHFDFEEQSASTSVLGICVSNVSEAYTLALGWCAKYLGIKDESTSYTINQEFIAKVAESGMVTAIVNAWQSGALRDTDMIRALQKLDLINPADSPDDVIDALRNQAPSLTGG